MSGRPSWKPAEIGLCALFLPFSPFSGGYEEQLANPENGGKRPFSSDILRLLKPPSLKPPFAAPQKMTLFGDFSTFRGLF